MSTFDYSEFQDLASEMFAEFGREVTLIKLAATPDDANKPWRGTTDPRDTPDDEVTLNAVMLDTISSRYLGLNIELDEGEKGEQKLCLVATADAPGKSLRDFNELIDGSYRYAVVALNILEPGDEEIFVAFKTTQRKLMS